ncbi:hypothetical protein [Pseudomonas frederiksbergensis]|uniref:hypothetical protein n=1 Tax=Pseudomonas TaxID=286 RepID=UPI0032E4BF04
MNTLNSYTNIKDNFNQRLFALLPKTRSILMEQELHFDSQFSELDPRPLCLSSQRYPYTPLGTLGMVNPSRENQIITPYLNRYADTSSPDNAGQLILLDNDTQIQIATALERDAKFTIAKEKRASEILLGEYQANAEWLIQNWETTKAHIKGLLNRENLCSTVSSHLMQLRNYNQAHYLKLQTAVWYDESVPSFVHDRTVSNGTKSASRIIKHYQSLGSDLSRKEKRTEARGDYAATKLFLTVMGPDFQMKMGKSNGNTRPHGIDQIWVRRDVKTGDVAAYYIVESKGSSGAHLGLTKTGEQMSSQWLFNCLLKMADGKKTHIDRQTSKEMPKKILKAMINSSPPVKGVIFNSLYGSQGFTKIIRMTVLRDYNCPGIYQAAANSQSLFSNATTSFGYGNMSNY